MEMSGNYYVAVGTNRMGPFSPNQIEQMVLKSRLALTEKVYRKEDQNWYHVSELLSEKSSSESDAKTAVAGLMPDTFRASQPDLPKKNKAEKRTTSPSPRALLGPKGDSGSMWYLREFQVILGPYSFLTMMMMWTEGTLTEDHYVKRMDLESWQKMRAAFSKEDRAFFKALQPEKILRKQEDLTDRRAHPREDLDLLFHVRKDSHCFVVQGYDISESGLSMVSLAPVLSPGDEIQCLVSLRTGKVLEFKGRVVRQEKVASMNSELSLEKYAIKLHEKLDLREFEKGD